MRRAFPLLTLLALLAVPASASAGPLIDRATSCLGSQPVCVDPAAEDILPASEAEELTREIDARNAGPMFVAVLPEEAKAEAGGSVDGVLQELHDQVGRNGTYAVVAGGSFSGGAEGVGFRAGPLAEDALAAHRDEGADAVLTDFVDRVGEEKAGGDGSASDPGGSVSSTGPLVILGLLGLGGGALYVNARRQRRRREERELAEVKEVARGDLIALGDDIRALDLDVEMPGVDPAAKADYNRSVELYDRANTAFDRARRPEDLAPVTEALEEGRFAMTSARARLAGQQPPERRPPCFFDPRHGPSVRDVEWAPPGGQPRPVPACAADAQRVEDGLDPDVRELSVGGRQVAYWNAPAYYSPWSGGYYGGFGGFGMGGGFLGGLLLGDMLGGWGGGWGGDYGGGDYGGGGDLGGGGDFGGGDFGGGDFGGGDF